MRTHLSETSTCDLIRFIKVASPRQLHLPLTNVYLISLSPLLSRVCFNALTESGTSIVSNLASKLIRWNKGMLYLGPLPGCGLSTRCVVAIHTLSVKASRPWLKEALAGAVHSLKRQTHPILTTKVLSRGGQSIHCPIEFCTCNPFWPGA